MITTTKRKTEIVYNPFRVSKNAKKQSQLPVQYIVLRLVKVPQLKHCWVEIGLKLTQDLQRFVKLENIPECKEDNYHYL